MFIMRNDPPFESMHFLLKMRISQSHRIHGTGIFTYIYHKYLPQISTIHVGKNIPVPWIRNGNVMSIFLLFPTGFWCKKPTLNPQTLEGGGFWRRRYGELRAGPMGCRVDSRYGKGMLVDWQRYLDGWLIFKKTYPLPWVHFWSSMLIFASVLS